MHRFLISQGSDQQHTPDTDGSSKDAETFWSSEKLAFAVHYLRTEKGAAKYNTRKKSFEN